MDENEYKDKEPIDYNDDFIRYGLITKKGEERSLDDTYMTFSDLESDDKKFLFSLFGIFDGHNNDYVSKYISSNIYKLFQKEMGNINNNNYKTKIEGIFKTIDKNLKEEEEKKENNSINKKDKNNKNENEFIDNKKYINIGVDEREINLFKNIIKNTKEIPDDCKQIEDSKIKDLLLFKNLFKYNNNYIYNNNDVDYIGSSASVVLINDVNVITANLGITVCILFNKEGEIKNLKDSNNNTKELNVLKNEHTFNNKEEKRRIKKFNQEIDYNQLKFNIYVPASRCFGFFKYKKDDILKEENQIISCVPDVRIYDINSIDFILLMTKGMIDLIGDNLKKFIEKIINSINEQKDNNEIKLSKIIEEYIKEKEIENEKNNSDKNNINNLNKNINQLPLNKVNNSIYVGKDDFAEENIIINELNNNYYKDIMNINKMNDPNFKGKSNTTCILIQLLKRKKRLEKKIDDNKKIKNEENDKNKVVEDVKKEEKKIEKKLEKIKNDNFINEEKNQDEIKEEKEIIENNKKEENDNKFEEHEKLENENKTINEKEKEENNINKKFEINNDAKEENKIEEENQKEENKSEENKKEENKIEVNKKEENKEEENKIDGNKEENKIKDEKIENEIIKNEIKEEIKEDNKKDGEEKEVIDS